MAHYREDVPLSPDRLSGGCMSLAAAADRRHPVRRSGLEGYSIGEDLFFSFAVVELTHSWLHQTVATVHYSSPVNRIAKTDLALERIALVDRRARQNRIHGLRASQLPVDCCR